MLPGALQAAPSAVNARFAPVHAAGVVIEHVEPRMKADQAYPPVVGVSVLRHRHGLDNDAAEARLMAELTK